MGEVWLICSRGVTDDYGTWSTDVMAVCSSEERARELRAGLWGGQPAGTWIDRVPVDALMDTKNTVTVEGEVPQL
jgi:hypothetical protein